MQISTSFAQLGSCTVRPVRPSQGSVEFCSMFVQIRLANQMLMLLNGRVARQGSYRMVISMELADNKEADYLSPVLFPTTNLDPSAHIHRLFGSVVVHQ